MFKKQHLIAVIDSGLNPNQTWVKKAFSVVDYSPFDTYGHGTEMLNTIYKRNPKAEVISIKAFQDVSNTKVDNIIKAIQLAINEKAEIINMSFSAPINQENNKIIPWIQKALDQNIKVVAACGDDKADANKMLPGCIAGVITVAASKNRVGNFNDNSNLGSCIDYITKAPSSSYAAALVSARLGYNKKSKLFKYFLLVNHKSNIKMTLKQLDTIRQNPDFALNAQVYASWLSGSSWTAYVYCDLSYSTSRSGLTDVTVAASLTVTFGSSGTGINVGSSFHYNTSTAIGTVLSNRTSSISSGGSHTFSGTFTLTGGYANGSKTIYFQYMIWQSKNASSGCWTSSGAKNWSVTTASWTNIGSNLFVTYTSVSITWVGLGVKIYNGSTWKHAAPKVYNGSTWKNTLPKIASGSTWRQTVG